MQAGEQPSVDVGASAAVTPGYVGVILVIATVLTGLVAGTLVLYAHTIMPGLKRTNDRTFVGAFQAIDRAIINPWFMVTFFGALVALGVACLVHLTPDRRSVLPWLVGAFVLYLGTVVITMAINVPLNDAIKAAGDPNQIDVAQVRAAFDEAKWATWNLVRTIATTGAFVVLVSVLASKRR